jgi:hypothetical protein
MLENYNTQSSKQQQGNQGAAVPGNDNLVTGRRKVTLNISEALPEPTNVGGGSTRLTANQIARSNRAGKVGSLGQMASLVLGGKEGSVPSRRGSAPSRVSLFTAVKRQGPAGIDAANRTKWYIDGSKYIYQPHFAPTNLDSGVIEASPGEQKAQAYWSQALRKTPKASFLKTRPQRQAQNAQHHPGDYLAKARAKDLHLVNDSLARGVFA